MVYINGFYGSSSPTATGIKTYKVPGTTTSLPVKAEIAPLLIGFATEFNNKVEKLVPGWSWGYAYRPVVGSSSPSFHSAGIAMDLNAPRHPLGKVGTFTAAQRRTINALCAKYGLRWGGNYTYRKDEMHFEVILSRTQALALVKRLQSTPTGTTIPKYVTGSRVMREGMFGTDVRDVQHALNILGNHIPEDGHFGPTTTYLVKRFQTNRGMTADGIVGPDTLLKIRMAIN